MWPRTYKQYLFVPGQNSALPLKHSLLKQATLSSYHLLFSFKLKKQRGRKELTGLLPYSLILWTLWVDMRAVQSAATVITGGTEVQMPGWQKSLLQHQMVPAGSWTRDLLSQHFHNSSCIHVMPYVCWGKTFLIFRPWTITYIFFRKKKGYRSYRKLWAF